MTMYFYSEDTEKFTTENVIKIFDVFKCYSKKKYTTIGLIEFNEYGTTIVKKNYKPEKFSKDVFAEKFLINFVGEDKFVSGFFGDEWKAYKSALLVEIWGGGSTEFPVFLIAQIRRNAREPFSIESFEEIMTQLQENGFSINNSFCDVNYTFGGALSHQGGVQYDISNIIYSRNLNDFSEHTRHKYRNHITGVYGCNSVKTDVLSEKQRQLITDICGENNVGYVNNNFVFSVVSKDSFEPLYRITEWKKIKRIRKIIDAS